MDHDIKSKYSNFKRYEKAVVTSVNFELLSRMVSPFAKTYENYTLLFAGTIIDHHCSFFPSIFRVQSAIGGTRAGI